MRWLVLCILLFISGCIQPAKPVWTVIPTAPQLLERIAVEAGRYSSLDGAAGVSLTTADKFFSSQQFFLLQRPNQFRTDVLTGFGQLILQLTSNGNELSVFLNTTVPGRFLQGPASNENLHRFTRMPLAVVDLLSLLLYRPPIIAHNKSNVEIVDGLLRLSLQDGFSEQQVFFDHRLQLVKSYYFKAEQIYLSVDYSDFAAIDGFPRTMVIEFPQEETRAKVTFTELELNGNIDAAKFQLRKPDNIELELLL